MYNVTEKYLNTLTEKTKTDRVEIKITLKDKDKTVINLTDEDIIKGSLFVNNQCLNGNEFQFGCTYAGECGFSFKDIVDRYALYDATVEIIYYRLLEDKTEERIPMGVYLIDEAEKAYTIMSVKALDRMTLLDVTLKNQVVGTVFELLTYLSTTCGFELAQTQEEIEALPNGKEMFSFYPDRIDSLRDCLGYLSAVTATFAIFDRFGKLKLCEFQTTENWNISNDFRIKSKFNDTETYYKGVTVRFLANQNFYPYNHVDHGINGGLILDMGDIPIVQGTPETKDKILENIFNCLIQIKYRPCEVDYFGNPAIDLGDYIKFSEGKSIVTNYNWNYRGKHTLKSIGLNPKLQVVKDKTYKQLLNMSADVEGCKIGIYTSVNVEKYIIQNEAVKVVTMQYSSVTDEKVIFLSSIQLEMDCDGEIEITYYVNQVFAEERTRRMYLSKGKHLLTLFDWVETDENSRNELWVFLQPFCCESVERSQTANIDTQKNRITALIDTVVNGTEFVEPTPTLVDGTVPTITILEQHAKGLVFGQGLATNGYEWDGTLNFDESLPAMAFDNTQALTIGNLSEDLKMLTYNPIPSSFEEILGVMNFEVTEMKFGTITESISTGSRQITSTITVDTPCEYDDYFVDIREGKFKPKTRYDDFVSVEVDSDVGLRAELSIDTTGITVSSLEVVAE